MKATVLLAARTRSERLPRKVVAPLCSHPVLEHIIERYRSCDRVEQVVVCTSPDPEDDLIAEIADNCGVPCYRSKDSNRGDVVSLLDGGLHAHAPDAELVHRGMCDCPLFEPSLLDWFVDILARFGDDLVWVGLPDAEWPVYGARESPWSRSAWDECVGNSRGDEREHAGLWIYKNVRRFRVCHLISGLREEYYRPYRLELDDEKDYTVIAAVYHALWRGWGTPSMLEAIQWLDEHPNIAAVNADVPLKSITTVDWKERGIKWSCTRCGAYPMLTGPIRRGALTTKCPRCGAVQRFASVEMYTRKRETRGGASPGLP